MIPDHALMEMPAVRPLATMRSTISHIGAKAHLRGYPVQQVPPARAAKWLVSAVWWRDDPPRIAREVVVQSRHHIHEEDARRLIASKIMSQPMSIRPLFNEQPRCRILRLEDPSWVPDFLAAFTLRIGANHLPDSTLIYLPEYCFELFGVDAPRAQYHGWMFERTLACCITVVHADISPWEKQRAPEVNEFDLLRQCQT